jgi:hypothetical protein
VFVRWKRRPLRRRRETSSPAEQALSAVLVETHRVDGRPRQRVVRYLATIKAGQLVYPLSVERFWQAVDARLAELPLADDQRHVIERKIGEAVPRPDPDVLARTRAEFEAWTASVNSMMRGFAGRRRRQSHPTGP